MQNTRNNKIDYLEFKTNNIEDTKKFYSEVFGWEFKDYWENYTAFSNSWINWWFEKTNDEIVNWSLIVLHHDDLDLIKSKIINAWGEINVDIFSFPGWKRFHFIDNTWNEMSVWTEL